MAVNFSPVGGVAAQFFNNDGVPLAGGLIYTYLVGSSTPAATYTTNAGTIAHSNPIVLDSAGRVPSGEIWLTNNVTYKFAIKDSSGSLIGTYDNISGNGDPYTLFYVPDAASLLAPGPLTFKSALDQITNNSNGAPVIGYLAPYSGSVATNVKAKLAQSVSVKDFGAVGDGTTDDTTAIQAAIDSCLTTGNSLYVPPGNYKLTSQINVPLFSASVNRGFVIFGAGHASRFIVNHTGAGFYVTCSPSFTQFQAEFRDLYFTDGTVSPARIIWNNGAINTLIRDCVFENATVSVGCVVNDNAYGLTLQGCLFTGIVGTGAFYAQVANISTYSFVNSIIDCDFSTLSIGVEMQGCDAFLVSNTVFQDCNIGFYANPISNQTTAFNITIDTCWFERNTTCDIQLESDVNYWCEASIRNTQFAGFNPTYHAHIQLAQKSKVTIEGTPAGNLVIVSGANDAAAVLIRATNFVQSGVYAWTSIDPYGNVLAKTYKSLSGVYINPASGATVTLTTLPTVSAGTWLVSAMLDGFNSASGAQCVGIVVAQGSTAVYTEIKTASILTVSNSGLNLQGNQTSGAPYSITWSLTRLS